MRISISLGETQLIAVLSDNETARAIYEALPMECSFHVWGDEIYFPIPVETAQPPERDVLEVGELAFWPPGNAFCIFFGRTPASVGDEPRAASRVVPFGKVQGDPTVLKNVTASRISIQKVEG